MDRIKKLKIKKQDGTFSDYIPIGADAENIDTTDGESVQLKLNKKPYYYNNVADMKADIKLKVGDMAVTLGYYEPNDGGNGEYKITNLNTGFTESLNNNLYATLIFKNEMNIKQFGLKGDGNSSDDAILLNQCFNTIPSGIKINFNTNDVYNIQTGIIINKDIEIDGKNALINIVQDDLTAFKITNDNTNIYNLNIDGAATTQDKFDATDFYSLNLISGFNINAKLIKINNINIKNFYGSAFSFIKSQEVFIDNINIDNVGGHWYINNTYDAFGDALYFRDLKKNAYIEIKNVNCNMKYKNDMLSRAGIVLEKNIDFPEQDTYTNVIIDNVILNQCDRCIHIENQDRHIRLKILNTYFNGNAWIFNYGTAYKSLAKIDNCSFDTTVNSYNGSKGFKAVELYSNNCIFNLVNHAHAFLTNCSGFTKNSILNNISNVIVNGMSDLDDYLFEKSVLNISTSLNTHLMYSAKNISMKECTINKDTFKEEGITGSVYITEKCIFNNFLPYCKGSGNKLYVQDIADIPTYLSRGYGITTYVNNIIYHEEMSGYLFPYDIEFMEKYSRNIDISDGNPTSMIQNRNTIPGQKYILIMIGTNSSDAFSRVNSGFDYCIITADSSNNLTASVSQKVGTYSSGFNLSIDTNNLTVTKSGAYATKYQSLLLPYNYISYIGLI